MVNPEIFTDFGNGCIHTKEAGLDGKSQIRTYRLEAAKPEPEQPKSAPETTKSDQILEKITAFESRLKALEDKKDGLTSIGANDQGRAEPASIHPRNGKQRPNNGESAQDDGGKVE